jgi:tetratricopeptide (TPR) repeat protein
MALAESFRMAGRNREACEAFEDASARLASLGRDETETAGTLYNNWGVALNTLGRPLEAERLFRRAIEISRADGSDRNVSPMLLNNLARTLRDLGNLSGAADLAERAHAKAVQGGDEVIVNQALSVRHTIYRLMGDLDRAEAMLEELEPRLIRMLPADHIFFATLVSHRSLLDQARGRLEPALAQADRALALTEASSQGLDYLPSMLLRRSGIALEMGRYEQARSDAARALEMEREAAEPGSVSAAIGRAELALGRALQELGKREEAGGLLRAATEHLEPTLGADHPDTREARRRSASLS